MHPNLLQNYNNFLNYARVGTKKTPRGRFFRSEGVTDLPVDRMAEDIVGLAVTEDVEDTVNDQLLAVSF